MGLARISVPSCHHMSSFGRTPPSPSSDDVIYEQPLRISCRYTHFTGCLRSTLAGPLTDSSLILSDFPLPALVDSRERVCFTRFEMHLSVLDLVHSIYGPRARTLSCLTLLNISSWLSKTSSSTVFPFLITFKVWLSPCDMKLILESMVCRLMHIFTSLITINSLLVYSSSNIRSVSFLVTVLKQETNLKLKKETPPNKLTRWSKTFVQCWTMGDIFDPETTSRYLSVSPPAPHIFSLKTWGSLYPPPWGRHRGETKSRRKVVQRE